MGGTLCCFFYIVVIVSKHKSNLLNISDWAREYTTNGTKHFRMQNTMSLVLEYNNRLSSAVWWLFVQRILLYLCRHQWRTSSRFWNAAKSWILILLIPRKLYNSIIHVTHELGIYIVKLLLHDDRLKFILSWTLRSRNGQYWRCRGCSGRAWRTSIRCRIHH